MTTVTNMQQLIKITECSICKNKLHDPRILPCVHTFCLGCLEECTKRNSSGEKYPCPLCKKTFMIPASGVKSLQRNVFMERFIEIINASTIATNQTEKCRKNQKKLEFEKRNFVHQCADTRAAIVKKADELKLLIDIHAVQLLQELTEIQKKSLKEMDALDEEINNQLLTFNKFERFSSEKKDEESSLELSEVADRMHVQVSEVKGVKLSSIPRVKVTFTPRNPLHGLMTQAEGNIIGCINAYRASKSTGITVCHPRDWTSPFNA